GDEILYGQIVDTNSQWMSAALDTIGVKTVRKTTIGDIEEDILIAFEQAEKRADIVLITGGLGPTKDDLTKPCLAKYFDSEIAMHAQALEELTALFKRANRELTDINRGQAELPIKAEMVSNPIGTAAGMWFHERGTVFVSMPGVPFEMKKMMQDIVIPKIKATFETPTIYHRLIKTIGIGESWLAEIIEDWENNLPDHIGLAYLPSIGQVKLRLTAKGNNPLSLEEDINKEIEKVWPSIEKYVFGFDDTTIEAAIGELLKSRNLTISTAESCTGGYVAHQLTSVPGSSSYFKGSIIAYDNAVKTAHLSVPEEILEEHGAVSEETIRLMATNVRKQLNTDIGVATSGIAGPGGGTPEKPVGTIWIAYADEHRCITKKLSFSRTRELNIKYTTASVLNLIRIETNRKTDNFTSTQTSK
ncbi:MAG: competence/damage-inducible protein A, partial [Bacteroidota bacterium]